MVRPVRGTCWLLAPGSHLAIARELTEAKAGHRGPHADILEYNRRLVVSSGARGDHEWNEVLLSRVRSGRAGKGRLPLREFPVS